MSEPSLEARRQLFIEGLLVRGALAGIFSLVAIIFAVFGLAPTTSTSPALGILAGLAMINIPYWFVGKARRFPLSDFFPHWLVDILFLTVLIHYIGGADAPYATIMYYSLVLFAAVSESRRVAIRLAGVSMLSFGMLVVCENLGVLSPVRVWDHHLSAAAQVLAFGVSTAFILALAFVGGTLADQLKQSNAELRAASAALEQHNRELEQRVSERTAELAAATQEIADLVHIVSHDLKNVAVGATETARQLATREQERLSDRGKEYTRHLLEDSRALSRMLEDLLRLFRATDPGASDREWIDVGEVVRGVVRRLEPQLERRNIELVVGDLPPVFAEQGKIRHIFDNLIDNACKYVGNVEAPRVEVGGRTRGGEVEYFVRDNGIGISERQKVRVFQLYHRVPSEGVNGRGPEGHGIGLAIVKRIVERYGGRIDLESELGQGSTFRVRLPAGSEKTA